MLYVTCYVSASVFDVNLSTEGTWWLCHWQVLCQMHVILQCNLLYVCDTFLHVQSDMLHLMAAVMYASMGFSTMHTRPA